VLHLAQLGKNSGLGGFVCSPHEVSDLRRALGPESVLVTPGVRPHGVAAGDQKRVATPADTVRAGSSMLVVGRPIRDAADPATAAAEIRKEMLSAVAAVQGKK
jgi:orotidine-5'-phosphate decarboxylase